MHHNHAPPRMHLPAGLIAGAAIVVLVPVVGCMAWLWLQWVALASSAPWFVEIIRFLAFATPISLAGGYAYAGLVILWRRYGSHEYIRATHITALTKAQR